jgi:outer membrane lipoprotein-sorting protein
MCWRRTLLICSLCSTLAIGTLAFSTVASPQTESDLASLTKKVAAHRASVSELQLEYQVTSEAKVGGKLKRFESAMFIAFRRPNFLRLHLKQERPSLMVSDGEWLWSYSEAANTYSKSPAPSSLSAFFDSLIGTYVPMAIDDTVTVLIPPSKRLTERLELLGQESLGTKAGSNVLCYVLKGSLDEKSLSIWGYDRGDTKLWINTSDLLTERAESTFVPEGSGGRQPIRITLVRLSSRLNEGLPPSLFSFVPPPNAKLRAARSR